MNSQLVLCWDNEGTPYTSRDVRDGELFIGDMNNLNAAFEAVRNKEFFTWETLINAFTNALINEEDY